jgi:ketosteroid isomerase-like protein
VTLTELRPDRVSKGQMSARAMQTRLILVVALILSQSCTGAQDNTVKTIQALEEEMNSAFNRYDAAALDRLWDQELTFVSPNGTLAGKAERLAGMNSIPSNIPMSTNESVAVTVHGDVAVAVVLSRWTGTNDGKPISTNFRATHVWRKRSDGWKLVAAHVSQMRG